MAKTAHDAARESTPTMIRINLRIWSDSEQLGPLVQASARRCAHLHVKGQNAIEQNGTAGRVFGRHYASFEDVETSDANEIVPIISQWLNEIDAGEPPIAKLANSGMIEAVLWIAIICRSPVNSPKIPEELTAQAKKLGVKVLVENYTMFDDEGVPLKIWLAA